MATANWGPTVGSVGTFKGVTLPSNTGGSSSAQLDAAKLQLKLDFQKRTQITSEKGKLKKPNPKDFAAVVRYKAQVAKYDATLKTIGKSITGLQTSIPKLQNKYYTDTGQYDKLLTGSNRDAFLAIESLFKSYGLESLAGKIYGYVKNGQSADTISIELQDTPEYKQRFAGNEARKAAGIPVLSAADYLATESSYRQLMQQAGLPKGFYDQPTDFNNWIGKDLSPTEVQGRIDMASQATITADPLYRNALNQMGIDDAHLTAYFLDTDKALPYLQKAAATAQVGAEALRQNLQFDQAYAEQLATMGISADQARQGYQQVAGEFDTMKALGSMYGEDWNQKTGEAATFGTQGSTAAQDEQKRLLSRERGAFGGSTGAARGLGGLSQSRGAQ